VKSLKNIFITDALVFIINMEAIRELQ